MRRITRTQQLLILAGIAIVLIGLFVGLRRDRPSQPPVSAGYERFTDPQHGVVRLDLPESFERSTESGLAPGVLAWFVDEQHHRQVGYAANTRQDTAEITPEVVEARIVPELTKNVSGFKVQEVRGYTAGVHKGAGVRYDFTVGEVDLVGHQVYLGVQNRLYTLYFVSLPSDTQAEDVLNGILSFSHFQ